MKTTRLTLLVITLSFSIKVFSQEYIISKKDSTIVVEKTVREAQELKECLVCEKEKAERLT